MSKQDNATKTPASHATSVLGLKPFVKFDDATGVGTVSKNHFKKSLENTELTDAHFEQVDAHREAYMAKITTEVMDHAEKTFSGKGDGTGLSVENIYLGGKTTGEVHLDPAYKLVQSVNHPHREDVMGVVLSRSEELWAKYNVAKAAEEPADVD